MSTLAQTVEGFEISEEQSPCNDDEVPFTRFTADDEFMTENNPERANLLVALALAQSGLPIFPARVRLNEQTGRWSKVHV